MNEFKVNEDGVPILSASNIEKKAEEVINFFNEGILLSPSETPLLLFMEELSNKFDFTYDLSQDIGTNAHGHKVLGKFRFRPKAIFVDKSLQGDLRQNFVLAHEFGHFVLHRKLLLKKEGYVDVDIADTEKNLVTGQKLLTTPRDWLEWQANHFASAILMPRSTFSTALINTQKSLGIHRNLGKIYLDEQKSNFRDFMRILEVLAKIYKVTNTNIEIRLRDLDLLDDVRGKSTKHISELFMEE